MPHIKHYAPVADNPEEAVAYLQDLRFEVRIEERDLHAEHMAAGEPGRASFFVAGRTYYCIDLVRNGGVVARRYAYGESSTGSVPAEITFAITAE